MSYQELADLLTCNRAYSGSLDVIDIVPLEHERVAFACARTCTREPSRLGLSVTTPFNTTCPVRVSTVPLQTALRRYDTCDG